MVNKTFLHEILIKNDKNIYLLKEIFLYFVQGIKDWILKTIL